MKCYFCDRPIGSDPVEDHHPDKAQFPDWTEPAHDHCHRQHHQQAGDFKLWGGLSATSGRAGYLLTLAKYPAFHSLGGKARARSARRDECGRFV